MKSELERRLNKQVHLQAWIFGLSFIYIFVQILIHIDSSNDIILITSVFLLLASGITVFVLWILGIVNAVKIQKITGNSVLLVVFSVILLWIAGIIVAVIERNKYKKQNYSAINNNVLDNH